MGGGTVLPSSGLPLYTGPPIVNTLRGPHIRYDSSTITAKLFDPSNFYGREVLKILTNGVHILMGLLIMALSITIIGVAEAKKQVHPLQLGAMICGLCYAAFNFAMMGLVSVELVSKTIRENPSRDELYYEYEYRKFILGNLVCQLLFVVYLSLILSGDTFPALFVMLACMVGTEACGIRFFLMVWDFTKHKPDVIVPTNSETITNTAYRLFLLFFVLTMVSTVMAGWILTDWFNETFRDYMNL